MERTAGIQITGKDKFNKLDIVIEAIKFVAILVLLVYVCFDAEHADALLKVFGVLFKAAIIALAYIAGREFAYTYTEGWRNYLLVFYVVGILSAIAWGNFGTHIEMGDILFGGGGGEPVVDFVPTKVERANHVIIIFASLFVPAMLGVRKGRNQFKR
jgi:hypothetical protein